MPDGDVPDGGLPAAARASSVKEVNPMQTLRASAIAVPFVFLALLVALLSAIIGAGV